MRMERTGKAIPYMSVVHKSIYGHTQIPSLKYSRLFLLLRYIFFVSHHALNFPNPPPVGNTRPSSFFLKFFDDN